MNKTYMDKFRKSTFWKLIDIFPNDELYLMEIKNYKMAHKILTAKLEETVSEKLLWGHVDTVSSIIKFDKTLLLSAIWDKSIKL